MARQLARLKSSPLVLSPPTLTLVTAPRLRIHSYFPALQNEARISDFTRYKTEITTHPGDEPTKFGP